jgi:predicted  nucleic acid-binding Zn-ribbon protein
MADKETQEKEESQRRIFDNAGILGEIKTLQKLITDLRKELTDLKENFENSNEIIVFDSEGKIWKRSKSDFNQDIYDLMKKFKSWENEKIAEELKKERFNKQVVKIKDRTHLIYLTIMIILLIIDKFFL